MTKSPTALDLPMVDPCLPDKQKYFDICQDKLGMIPNVLQTYAFDMTKADAFTAMYNDLMLGAVGLSQTGTRDDRGRRVVDQQMLLLPDGARSCGAPIVWRSDAWANSW